MVSSSKKNASKLELSGQVVDFNIDTTILDGVLLILNKDKIWAGTMTDLGQQLAVKLGKKRTLPGSPSALRIVLNRVINRLRSRGVSVKFGRANNQTRTRYVKFITH